MLLAAIAVLPVVLAFVFRINTVLLFFSLMVGSVLERSLGSSTELAIAAFARNAPVFQLAHFGLLLLPMLLSLVLFRKTLRTRSIPLQLLPLLVTGLAVAVWVLPLLSAGVRGAIFASQYSGIIRQSGDVILGSAAALNFLVAWRLYRHRDLEGKHHGK